MSRSKAPMLTVEFSLPHPWSACNQGGRASDSGWLWGNHWLAGTPRGSEKAIVEKNNQHWSGAELFGT